MFENEENFDSSQNHDRVRQMPIFLNAKSIAELVRHLVKLVEKSDLSFEHDAEKEMLANTLSYMRQNAYIIPAKISGAEAVEIYDLKMENAAIIRKAAREL